MPIREILVQPTRRRYKNERGKPFFRVRRIALLAMWAIGSITPLDLRGPSMLSMYPNQKSKVRNAGPI